MDNAKRQLQGSESRDIFKRRHKDLSSDLWATDLDFVLIGTNGIVAFLDFKKKADEITWTEQKAYDDILSHMASPIFIVISDDPENGPFEIREYIGANKTQHICYCQTWKDYEIWEIGIRKDDQDFISWLASL